MYCLYKGSTTDPDNIVKIVGFAIPKGVCDVCGILAKGNHYHQCVKDISQMIQALVTPTKKENHLNDCKIDRWHLITLNRPSLDPKLWLSTWMVATLSLMLIHEMPNKCSNLSSPIES